MSAPTEVGKIQSMTNSLETQMQQGFSDMEYLAKKRQTRRERFLQELDRLTPWEELQAVVVPFYPSGRRGRPTRGAGHMLRMYMAQQCLGLSDEGIEDAIYDSHAVRRFVGIDLSRETAPGNEHLFSTSLT
jgi:IS5 family transposase